MPMSFRIRSSKFRHVYGSPFRKEQSYENVWITRNAHDSNFCAVNPKNLAVVTESAGGGAFLVLPVERTGRVDVAGPKVSGHAGAVLDIKWNPFHDDMIASCSDDCTVKLWKIPPEGLITPLTQWWVDLHGHGRRVTYLEWHPTAENIILSTGFDFKCVVWNVEQAEPVNIVDCHKDTIFSIAWNREGSLFSTTSKDKRLRVVDPRTCAVSVETLSHKGPKASKVVFVDNVRLATTGFSQMSERQLSLWDLRNPKVSLSTTDLDTSCGVILPYYDFDTRIVFLAGKGDANIRYYEVSEKDSCFHFLNVYQSPSPQRGLGMMPKRGCDYRRCEVARFYKLHAGKNLVEPISMIVPRKSDIFQEDVYPPTASAIPSLQADEWISGQNREPILVSLQDGAIVCSPQITTSQAVQKQDSTLQHPPTITTFKAVDRSFRKEPTGHTESSVVQLRRQKDISGQRSETSELASLKNIQRLSLNEDIVTVPSANASSAAHKTEVVTPPGAEPSTNGMSSINSEQSTHTTTKMDKFVSNRVRRPVTRSQTISSSAEHTSQMKIVVGQPSLSTQSNTIHICKTWRAQPPSSPTKLSMSSLSSNTNALRTYSDASSSSSASLPSSEAELKSAYFQQLEEISNLKQQLALKDKRIRQLESELTSLREKEASVGPGESNC